MVIFFDIDDTLINSEVAHVNAIRETCSEYALKIENTTISDREWLTITDKFLKLYFEGEISLSQQRILRIREFWERFGQQITAEKAQIVYHRYHQLFLRSCKAFNDTISSLEILSSSHGKLGIISNGVYSDQIFKLKNNRLLPYFKYLIVSEKVGFSKPDKEIFDFASRQTGTVISDCIYIGDSYQLDYVGSLNAGMKPIWLDRKYTDGAPDCIKIHSLNDLEKHVYFGEY